ncbi:MAG: UDP-N-acetylmuramoyl-L-alanine--D-glutamate ligase [Clostridia bacterium]|nr:UDP-N-acetylmuramoyl-L-alanine--D-glutamate ligase [Clostridia bacterium]
MNGYVNEKAKVYKEFLKGKTATVIGAGISNIPLINFLLENGCTVNVRDKKEREALCETLDVAALEEKGVTFGLGEGYLRGISSDIIYKTPGVRFDNVEILNAYDAGSYITSEMEAFISICPAKIVAITGSNGKTTTSTLCAKLLEASGHRVFLGGNIGKPLLSQIDEITPDDFVVLELSSFQLHTVNRFDNAGLPFAYISFPDSAIITNVSPNHLDWHTSMQEYADAKRAVFDFMKAGGRLVTNADCSISSGFARDAEERELDIVLFSREGSPKAGIYYRDGAIYRRVGSKEEKLLDTDRIIIPGLHNVENYMAAYAATEPYLSEDALEKVATTFTGVSYRLELCHERGGVKYYDSSIDSSPSRTEAALSAFPESMDKKINIILGGYDKKIPFETSFGQAVIKKVKRAFICGATAKKIQEAILKTPGFNEDTTELIMCADFDEAVNSACDMAESGECVLLSPACASFDAFKNFEERGKRFKELVRNK